MENTNQNNYSRHFLARIVVESATPLAVGSGEKDIRTDSLVATDCNGLPYIPATSIAGVLRSMCVDKEAGDMLFGYQNGDSGHGSEIIFTEARVIDSKGRVIDGINTSAIESDPLLKHYQMLPVRQHVRLNGKGVAVDTGLFNEQVVYAGTRFCFEIEMVSDGSNFNRFEEVLRKISTVDFRLGGGTRKGFGKIHIVQEFTKWICLDLNNEDDLRLYLEKTSSLDDGFWDKSVGFHNLSKETDTGEETDERNVDVYSLNLKPEGFFLFGSGFGDDDADMTPVKAKKVEWSESADGRGRTEGCMKENLVLIPASSLKGALEHRVAFYWNRNQHVFADELTPEKLNELTDKRNAAVRVLFGYEEAAAKDGKSCVIMRGNVIFSDIIEGTVYDKILNHVAIDRFTGGAIGGALFSEKASYGGSNDTDFRYETEILIDNTGLKRACKLEWGEDSSEKADELKSVFKAALDDLCKGMLSLGGGVNRGHGVFKGSYNVLENKTHEGI
ncbi:MAG: CRISPR-associated protein [Muribaculaceae bacterium]|nr:CRISPR-associated protein [Muribaculaceae bacterium]